jgi:hypothetical protein
LEIWNDGLSLKSQGRSPLNLVLSEELLAGQTYDGTKQTGMFVSLLLTTGLFFSSIQTLLTRVIKNEGFI